jgi:hypothetical protein
VYALVVGLVVPACGLIAAAWLPAPELADGPTDGRLIWDLAMLAMGPLPVVYLVFLIEPSVSLRACAAAIGLVLAEALWVLRVPRPDADETGGDDHGGGGGWGPRPPKPPPARPLSELFPESTPGHARAASDRDLMPV